MLLRSGSFMVGDNKQDKANVLLKLMALALEMDKLEHSKNKIKIYSEKGKYNHRVPNNWTVKMYANKFPLMLIEGRAEGLACTDPGARTPIVMSGNYSTMWTLGWATNLQKSKCCVWYLSLLYYCYLYKYGPTNYLKNMIWPKLRGTKFPTRFSIFIFVKNLLANID